jgi:hypothetical protein
LESYRQGEQLTVEVRRDHHIKLVRLADELHAGVVHNHLLKLNAGEAGGDLAHGLEEHAVSELHDVGLRRMEQCNG